MTIQKAIEILKNERPGCGEKVIYTESERCESYDIAISASEKQIPKKVEIWNGQATCPNCKKLYGNMVDIKQLHPASWDFEYCKHCGQRLDW